MKCKHWTKGYTIMDSNNVSYHSESEFYYPDEENTLQENKNFENTSNDIEDREMSTIQEFIEAQRPENMIKKPAMTLMSGKDFVCLLERQESLRIFQLPTLMYSFANFSWT